MKLRLKQITSLLVEAGQQFVEDRAPRLGAALSFYTVVSLAPLLLVIAGIAGQIYGEAAVRGEIVAQIEDTVGTEVALLIENALTAAALEADGLRVALIGLVGLLIGASTVFVHLRLALNTVWGIEKTPGAGGFLRAVRDFLLERVLVVTIMLGIGVVILAMLLASTGLEAAAVWLDDVLPIPTIVLRIGNALLAMVVLMVIFAYIYRTLPDVRIQWREVWLGAFITALLFTIGKELIALYLGRSAVGSAYGAAGSLMVLLVWVYYSAQIFFYGAEVTRVFAMRYGAGWRGRRGFEVADDTLTAATSARHQA